MTARHTRTRQRIGLQVKSILILTVVVLTITAGSGWTYFSVTKAIIEQNDRLHAEQLASNLVVSAREAVIAGDRKTLRKLAASTLSRPEVFFVAILDRHGKPLATAESNDPLLRRPQLAFQPPSLSYELRGGRESLEIGRPILASTVSPEADLLAGAVVVTVDTRETAAILAGVQQEVALAAAAIILFSIPLGHLLVWRVIVSPIRMLLRATRRLANGDFSARTQTRRNDEIGQLAASFDSMAEKLSASRQQLRRINESLEKKVAERTCELERINTRLREEMADKEEFLRAVSHDLNAPLRNIAGMATMISGKYAKDLPADALARLERIQVNVRAETELINELLELSRIKTRPEAREYVDFAELLEELRSAFEYELKSKHIRLEILLPMPRLYVERNRMRQVFQNLIDNAVKYMGRRADARIEIGYEQVDDMHQFYVSDNGPGIAPEDQDRIFRVFRRAKSAADVPGKGVGLAWVKSVVSNYEGRVWVSSEPGVGSTFFVSLYVRCTQGPQEGPGSPSRERSASLAVAD